MLTEIIDVEPLEIRIDDMVAKIESCRLKSLTERIRN